MRTEKTAKETANTKEQLKQKVGNLKAMKKKAGPRSANPTQHTHYS